MISQIFNNRHFSAFLQLMMNGVEISILFLPVNFIFTSANKTKSRLLSYVRFLGWFGNRLRNY